MHGGSKPLMSFILKDRGMHGLIFFVSLISPAFLTAHVCARTICVCRDDCQIVLSIREHELKEI
jgi:hypothetical protein